MQSEYFLWRLVLDGVCTLRELETDWSLDDVYRANALLDMKSYHENLKMNQAKIKGAK